MEFKAFKDVDILEEYDDSFYGNELLLTKIIGKLAIENDEIYNMLTTFEKDKDHSIYLEAQPETIYPGIEKNTHLDMALGAISIRKNTVSGIKFDNEIESKKVCFVEAKYFADLSIKTKHSVMRNQMNRIIENLLYFSDHNKENMNFPEEYSFTLLTPRKFKENFGTRFYSYLFNDYSTALEEDKQKLSNRIILKNKDRQLRGKYTSYTKHILKSLDNLKINWITYEEILEEGIEGIDGIDITNAEDLKKNWETIVKSVRSVNV